MIRTYRIIEVLEVKTVWKIQYWATKPEKSRETIINQIVNYLSEKYASSLSSLYKKYKFSLILHYKKYKFFKFDNDASILYLKICFENFILFFFKGILWLNFHTNKTFYLFPIWTRNIYFHFFNQVEAWKSFFIIYTLFCRNLM